MATACEEADEEAAIAIAENEGLVAEGEIVEEVGAGALEERAEGEVFGEAVDAGYGVEVGGGGSVLGRKRMQIQRSLHYPFGFAQGRSRGRIRGHGVSVIVRTGGRGRGWG